ncbi:PE-PGRS family protein [Streptomyces antibioticus]|uniref:PE-PGRS family protein n=1 Tax=Streptomyces antibioticus TaxID=1890 RepID=UPI0033FA79CC
MTGDELKALLGRAGLVAAEHWRTEEVLPARAAWRRITAAAAHAPTPAVRADRPAEIDACWHQLALAHGLFDADGVFLIDVEGDRPAGRPQSWTRVRLGPGWGLARVLAERAGPQPEFVTMPVGGDLVLGVTAAGGGEVRITVVERLADRVEADARTAAEEIPDQRAAAWESLFEEPSPSPRLRALWANGLGGNPAAPDGLRIALLERSDHLSYLPQPPAVVAAALAHESWAVRGAMAEYQRGLTGEQRARQILAEDDPKRRAELVLLAAGRHGAELPAAVPERLAADASPLVREQVPGLAGLPGVVLTTLAADPDARVRAAACGPAWPHLDEEARRSLLEDPDGAVRAAALLRHHEDRPMPRSVFEAERFTVDAVANCRLERDLAEWLADTRPEQRRVLAGNPRLHRELVLRLGADPDPLVRLQASVHPVLTEEERAGIDFPRDLIRRGLDWVEDLRDDPDALRRLAASAHPVVRSAVARVGRLPADVVELLARDEDRVVRLFLAESCEDAPAEMLLSVWRWWTGSFSHPDVPHGHRNFPRRDLLRYADDSSPRMRRLALDDPDSTAELVERFGRDPAEEVRRRAASDPRLSAASAVRLLSDPHEGVRYEAARHPRLPARTMADLLRDPESAQEAARHPGIPVAVMRRMAEATPERVPR